MAKNVPAMHVAKIVSRQKNKAGDERVYVSHLLRHSYRDVRPSSS